MYGMNTERRHFKPGVGMSSPNDMGSMMAKPMMGGMGFQGGMMPNDNPNAAFNKGYGSFGGMQPSAGVGLYQPPSWMNSIGPPAGGFGPPKPRFPGQAVPQVQVPHYSEEQNNQILRNILRDQGTGVGASSGLFGWSGQPMDMSRFPPEIRDRIRTAF